MSIKILSIDDSRDILFVISAICELENWETVTETSGKMLKILYLKKNRML